MEVDLALVAGGLGAAHAVRPGALMRILHQGLKMQFVGDGPTQKQSCFIFPWIKRATRFKKRGALCP